MTNQPAARDEREALARVLCQADGIDPDKVESSSIAEHTLKNDGTGSHTIQRPISWPIWKAYEHKSAYILAAGYRRSAPQEVANGQDSASTSPSAEALVFSWIRDTVPLAGKMNLFPKHTSPLIDAIIAYASARVAEAVERERAENIRIAESTRSGKYMQSWNNACGAVAIAILARKP